MADASNLRGSTFELNGESFVVDTYEPTVRDDGKIDMMIKTACGQTFDVKGAQMISNTLIDDPPCVDCGDEDEARAIDVRDGKVRCWACLPEPKQNRRRLMASIDYDGERIGRLAFVAETSARMLAASEARPDGVMSYEAAIDQAGELYAELGVIVDGWKEEDSAVVNDNESG